MKELLKKILGIHSPSKEWTKVPRTTKPENVDRCIICGEIIPEGRQVCPICENDPVNRPAHYTDGKIEVIEYIEDKRLGFCLGNAVKYISRAGKKDPSKEIEDLNKAIWYINRRIKELSEGGGVSHD